MSRYVHALLVAICAGLACTPYADPLVGRTTNDAEVTKDHALPPAIVPPPAITPKPTPASTTWTSLEIATGCVVQIADTPAALGAPLDWQQCIDGPEGCLEVANQSDVDELDPGISVKGLAHGDQVTLAVASSLSGGLNTRYVLAPRDGLPFFAIEGPHEKPCSLGSVGLSDDGAVVEVTFDHTHGYASRAYLRGPLREDVSWKRVAAVLPRREFPHFVHESVFSAGGRVVVEAKLGPIRWFDIDTGRWVEVLGSHGGECCASGHGDAVVFMIESIPEQVMAAHLGERAHPLRSGPVDGTSPVAIDGARAVWIEGRDRDSNNCYKCIELWTAEVTPGLTLANAAMVTVLPSTTMITPAYGSGVAVMPLQDTNANLAVVRLDTPDIRVLKLPEGQMVEQLLWVTADEIAVQIGPGGWHVNPSQFWRIPLAVLAPMRWSDMK